MKPPALAVDMPFPVAATYARDVIAREFWRLSFKVPRTYCEGSDAKGKPIITQHPREEPAAYAFRKDITKAQNYAGPIIRRYNDFVFRLPPTRAKELPAVVVPLIDNADQRGTPLTNLLRRELRRSQIERESYLLPARTGADKMTPGGVTVQQAQQAGIHAFIRCVGADDVLWWHDRDGVLDSCAITMCGEDGQKFVRVFEPLTCFDVQVDQNTTQWNAGTAPTWKVTGWTEDVAHGYKMTPVVRMRPVFDDAGNDCPTESQCAPIAEQQQAIANYLALLNEEIFSSTFTQMVAFGVNQADVKDVSVGSNRVICIPNPAAKLDTIGADVAQAESIRAQIRDCRGEIWRAAGISPGNPTENAAPESGVAKAFAFNDLAANLSALADCVQEAENRILRLFAQGYGQTEPGPTKYSADFDMPDFDAELQTVLKTVASTGLPDLLVSKIVERFASRVLALTDDEAAELAEQIKARSKIRLGAAGGAFPESDTEGLPTGKGAKAADATAAGADVAKTALNGAQVTSLMDLLALVVNDQMPEEAARIAIKQAFPLMDPAAIDSMAKACAKFTPKPPATPAPFTASP